MFHMFSFNFAIVFGDYLRVTNFRVYDRQIFHRK
jgi:hypothetical protein